MTDIAEIRGRISSPSNVKSIFQLYEDAVELLKEVDRLTEVLRGIAGDDVVSRDEARVVAREAIWPGKCPCCGGNRFVREIRTNSDVPCPACSMSVQEISARSTGQENR